MTSDSLIGRTIGVYKILSKIGQGGMAEIYQGFHPALRRHVAIKLLGRSLQADPQSTQRFQREAQAIASLRHSNIVQIFDFGPFEGGHYLVMEYVEGTDLRVEMDRRRFEERDFAPNEILHILDQIASGLDYAHRQGIVHRDVKPGNILMTTDGQAILTDFGLAMLRDRVSQISLGHTFGTPAYIAPEQALDSRAAVPQSDIYALGGLLYEITTGHLPFEAESAISLALMHVSEEPTPPRSHAPHLPEAVEAVILRALAKEPAARFSTAQEMVAALRRAWSQNLSEPDETMIASGFAPGGPPPPLPPQPQATAQPSPAPRPVLEKAHSDSEEPGEDKRRRWLLWAGLPAILLIALFIFLLGKRGGGASSVSSATPTLPTATTVVLDSPTTAAPTEKPTQTPTSAPTATSTATPTPAPTIPPTPVDTPTSAPTSTHIPTDTPPPSPTPTLAPGESATRSVDGMAMRFVPGGPFLMGASDDPDALLREQPQHQVSLSPFWMDETEVSNDQYRLCVEAGVCTEPANYATDDVTAYDDLAKGGHPVVFVTWTQAGAYCEWLAAETGWDVRLPSEAQWEKAASWEPDDGPKRRYPWGDEDPDETYLNYLGSGLARTAVVGSYPEGASPYGVLDVAGNVWEWVGDWYDADYYDVPDLPSDPSGPAEGTNKIMRGGSYGYGAQQARTTHREVAGDFERAKSDALGFRCAVNAERLP